MTAEGTCKIAILRRIKIVPGMALECARRVEASALPIMKKVDGFKGYLLVAVAHDAAITISLFTDKAAAETWSETMRPWFNENIGPLLAGPIEGTGGEIVAGEML